MIKIVFWFHIIIRDELQFFEFQVEFTFSKIVVNFNMYSKQSNLLLFLYISIYLWHLSLINAVFLQNNVTPYSHHTLVRPVHSDIESTRLDFDSCTFVTQVSLMNTIGSSKTNNINFDSIPMSLSLFTNESFIIGLSSDGCDDFINYDCVSAYQCISTNKTHTVDYPSFRIEGVLANAGVYLDYEYLRDSHMQVTYVKKCQKDHKEEVLPTVAGFIGLGIGGQNGENFSYSPLFSIFIHPDGHNGELLFGLDLDRISDPNDNFTFTTNVNWEISLNSSIFLQTPNSSKSLITKYTGTAIFDMNSCFIGVPTDLFDIIIEWLHQYGLACENSNKTVTPYTCKHVLKNQTGFPSILFEDITKRDAIIIEPKIYLYKVGESMYKLMIVPLSASHNGVTVTDKYINYIILGLPYLQRHYLYFDGQEGNQVTVYKSRLVSDEENDRSGQEEDPMSGIYIFFGVLVGVLICAVLIFSLSCRNKDNEEARSLKMPRGYRERPSSSYSHSNSLRERLAYNLEAGSKAGVIIRPSRFRQENRLNETL